MDDAFGSMAVQGSGDDTVRRVMQPLDEARGWMKFLAVLLYITGGVYAITIVGLIFAWLPIWVGYLLWKSASSAEAAHRTGSESEAIESLGRLKTMFTIYGVVTVISIALSLLAVVGLAILGANLQS